MFWSEDSTRHDKNDLLAVLVGDAGSEKSALAIGSLTEACWPELRISEGRVVWWSFRIFLLSEALLIHGLL